MYLYAVRFTVGDKTYIVECCSPSALDAYNTVKGLYILSKNIEVYDSTNKELLYTPVTKGPATVYFVDFKFRRLVYKAVPEQA